MTSVDGMQTDNRWVLVAVIGVLVIFAGWTWAVLAGW